jgi:hypothetical protein
MYFYGIYVCAKHFYRAQKFKLLTGLTCEVKENYKYVQKQNVIGKQCLNLTTLILYIEYFVRNATFLYKLADAMIQLI